MKNTRNHCYGNQGQDNMLNHCLSKSTRIDDEPLFIDETEIY